MLSDFTKPGVSIEHLLTIGSIESIILEGEASKRSKPEGGLLSEDLPTTEPVTDKLNVLSYRNSLLHQLEEQKSVMAAALQIGEEYRLIKRVGVLHGSFYSTVQDDTGHDDLFLYAPFNEVHLDYLPKRHTLRVSLWQATHSLGFTRFMNKVFFDFLLPYRGAVMSSNRLTAAEWTLWASRLDESFQLGHHVYLIDTVNQAYRKLCNENEVVETSLRMANVIKSDQYRYSWMVTKGT